MSLQVLWMSPQDAVAGQQMSPHICGVYRKGGRCDVSVAIRFGKGLSGVEIRRIFPVGKVHV